MTVQSFMAHDPQEVQGTGPYTAPWPARSAEDVRVVILTPGAPSVALDQAQYTVSLFDHATDVMLSDAAAEVHEGAILWLDRRTVIEQGWLPLANAREVGLADQLDRLTFGVQEVYAIGDVALRFTAPVLPVAPQAGHVLTFDDAGQPTMGPSASDIAAAQQAAQDAIDAAARAEAAENSLLVWTGPWETARAYKPSDLARQDGATYSCIEAHTSGTFSADLSAGRWQLFAAKGAAGEGTGDMLAAENLADLDDAPTARDNLGLATVAATGSFSDLINAPLAGFRNAIINGNFDIWQRGTSFSGLEYGADRWVNNRFAPATQSREAFALGQTAVPHNPQYFCRTSVGANSTGSAYSFLMHLIEDVRTFAGQTVTLSFWAKADASRHVSVDLIQNFGTGGTPSSVVDAIGVTKVAIGTEWQKITITADIPSISGKTLGTDGNSFLGLRIWFSAGSNYNAQTDSLGNQSGVFDIAQVQLEAGAFATPFERRPLAVELPLCQRYYFEELTGTRASLSGSGEGFRQCTVHYPTEMRRAPTISATTTVGTINTGFSVTTRRAVLEITVGNSTQVVDVGNFKANAEL